MKIVTIDNGINIDDEINFINKVCKNKDISIFIGDLKYIDNYYLNKLGNSNMLIVLIDVLRDMGLGSDIIINGGIYANKYEMANNLDDKVYLLGAKYNLLRDQFKNCEKRNINREVKNILITMGGADILNLTLPIIMGINKLNSNLNINVIVGDAFSNKKDIQNKTKELSNVNLYNNVNNMKNIMYYNDIAISAGGTTLYELAATGTPSISILQAKNQILQTATFDKKKIIKNIDININKTINRKQLLTELSLLIESYSERKVMSQNGQEEIDGRGAERCFLQIVDEYYRKIDYKYNSKEYN